MTKISRLARRLVRSARGNTAMVFSLVLGVLAISAGAGVTIANANTVATELQDQVDALALRGAIAMRDGEDPSALEREAASALALLSGGTAGTGSATAELRSSDPFHVAATMERDLSVLWGGLIGYGTVTVTRHAEAVVSAGDPVCLLVLDPDNSQAFVRRGNSGLEGEECAAQVNSTSPGALQSMGGGRVRTKSTMVSGPSASVGGFSPEPVFGAPAIPDPYANLVWPELQASCQSAPISLRRETRTLAAGQHCGGLILATGSEVVLEPGVHVVVGDLVVTSGSRLVGEDVTLIVMGPTSTVRFQAGAEVTLKAQTSGPYAGLALAIAPQPTELTSEILGGPDFELEGALYMPTQRLFITGGGRLAQPTNRQRMIVVNRLETRGNGAIYLNGRDSRAFTAGGAVLLR